jgi:SAM-dependent methyltransferase
LAALRDRGYQCIGVELSEDVSDWIADAMHVEVRTGRFPGIQLPQCDLFLAMDVLEHSLHPREFVEEVSRLLVSGGTAIIQTPIERDDYRCPFRGRPELLDDLDHAFVFSDRSLLRLVELAKLHLVSLDSGWRLGHEVVVLRKA